MDTQPGSTNDTTEGIIKAAEGEFRGQSELARKAAIYLSHRCSGRSLREIGKVFDIGESAVSRAVFKIIKALQRLRGLFCCEIRYIIRQ